MQGIEGVPILWADASVEKFEADFDEFRVEVREDNSSRKLLRCLGYTDFQIIGFWDEMIIQRASVSTKHAFITECESQVAGQSKSGSEHRIAEGNRLLEIVFIDGCKLWICASRFVSEQL